MRFFDQMLSLAPEVVQFGWMTSCVLEVKQVFMIATIHRGIIAIVYTVRM